MTSAAEYGLTPLYPITPDKLVALAEYRSRKALDAALHTSRTGDMISGTAVIAAIAAELTEGSLEELRTLLFAGEMVAYDRELAAMDPLEREKHEQWASSLLDDVEIQDLPADELAEHDRMMEGIAATRREVEELNRLFEE